MFTIHNLNPMNNLIKFQCLCSRREMGALRNGTDELDESVGNAPRHSHTGTFLLKIIITIQRRVWIVCR